MMSAGRICVLIVVGVGVSLKKTQATWYMSVMELCGFFWKMPGKKWDGNLLQGLIVCPKKIGHEKDPKISSIRKIHQNSSCFRNQQPKTKWFG